MDQCEFPSERKTYQFIAESNYHSFRSKYSVTSASAAFLLLFLLLQSLKITKICSLLDSFAPGYHLKSTYIVCGQICILIPLIHVIDLRQSIFLFCLPHSQSFIKQMRRRSLIIFRFLLRLINVQRVSAILDFTVSQLLNFFL